MNHHAPHRKAHQKGHPAAERQQARPSARGAQEHTSPQPSPHSGEESSAPRQADATLQGRIAAAIAPSLADLGYDLVRVAIQGGAHRPTVQIMADRTDGAPIGVEDCEAISHHLGAVLDVENLIPGAWMLEISSPGIDRPLSRPRDWQRFAGHRAKAELAIPLDGRKRFAGTITAATETHATIRLDDGADITFALADIARAKLVLTDELIAATAAPPAKTN